MSVNLSSEKNILDSKELAFYSAKSALDKKAENLKILELKEISSFTDYFLLCSAMSDRQVQAISDAIVEYLKKNHKVSPVRIDGYPEGRWVVIDYGDLVVHIFIDEIREYYNLEDLWSDAPQVEIPQELYLS